MSQFAQIQPIPAGSASDGSLSPLLTVRLLRVIAQFVECHGWGAFGVLSLGLVWGSLSTMIGRRLDHDELFTFYIAQAPTIHELLRLTHTVDLHPPLSYLLVRGSFAIFGVSSWSCRLPFLLAFVATSALLFFILSRLFSPIYGLISTMTLWSISLAYLATEARPYSMVLCFATALLVSWHRAVERKQKGDRRWLLSAVAASGIALLLSHILGVIAFAGFFVAEFVRFYLRREPDWGVWVALMLPLISVSTYIPLIHDRSAMLFAQEYRVTPLRMVSFYWESVRYLLVPFSFIGMLAFVWPHLRKQADESSPAETRATSVPFLVLLGYLSLVPLAIGILFARSGTAFFDRYGIVWLIPLTIVPVVVLAVRTQRNRLAATLTMLLLATAFILNTSGKAWLVGQLSNLFPAGVAAKLLFALAAPPIITVHFPPTPGYLQASLATVPLITDFDSVAPELPLVANTGLTFLELDHQGSEQLTDRFYMLTDAESASSIARDTVFAHYEKVRDAFHLRSMLAPYCAFVSAHPRFVVIGAYNNPQGWLLRKLDHDKAELRAIGTCSGFSEDCQIYQVSVRSKQCQESSKSTNNTIE